MALFNRTVRMEIYCNNINNRTLGYILWKIGDGNEAFDLTVEQYEFILNGAAASTRGFGGASAWVLPALVSSAAALVLSVALIATP